MKIGKVYKIPCLIRTAIKENLEWEQDAWMDVKPIYTHIKVIEYIPVMDHPHNDLENGQPEIHYHSDFRFRNMNDDYQLVLDSRPQLKDFECLEYINLTYVTDQKIQPTPVRFINKSKLKHKCIHKGKCPHRGMDLSNEAPDENGIITCPLHSLKFNAKTKQLINEF